MAHSEAEREAIGLCIALEAIDDTANQSLLELRRVETLPEQVEVCFHSQVHRDLFLIRFLDFASERGDGKLIGVNGSCLDAVLAACDTRSFDRDGSIASLEQAATALKHWLETNVSLKLWLPTLDLEATLVLPRLDLLHVSGNQAKHNLSRLTGVSRCISEALCRQGHNIPIDKIPLALDDFHEHLQGNYFIYHATWIAELLNSVRWGIHEYLIPTFHSSYRAEAGDPPRYSYRYPESITSETARAWFWRLMNQVRNGPSLRRFVGAHELKVERPLP